MTTLSSLIVVSLVVWRISSLIYVEHWFDRFRALFGVVYDVKTGENTYPSTWIGNTLSCFWCITTIVCWVGLLWPAQTLIERVMLCPAASAGAILIELWIKRRLNRR